MVADVSSQQGRDSLACQLPEIFFEAQRMELAVAAQALGGEEERRRGGEEEKKEESKGGRNEAFNNGGGKQGIAYTEERSA